MPAIAICPNYIFTSQATRNYPGEWYSAYSPLTLEHMATCAAQEAEGGGYYNASTDSFNFYGHLLLTDMWRGSVLPIDDFLVGCRWQRFDNFTCSSFFEIFPTNYGVCYKIKNFYRSIPQAGQDFGLFLILDLNQPEVLLAESSEGAGVQLVLFEPGKEMPLERQNSYSLAPGFEHYVALEKHVTKRLSTPYNDLPCVSDADYTQGVCLNDCLMRSVWSDCECFLGTETYDTCTLCDFLRCYNYLAPDFYSGNCNCSLACTEVKYKATVTSQKFPSEVKRQVVSEQYFRHYEGNATLLDQNAMQIFIYFNTLDVTQSEEKASLSMTQVVSDLGGALGLCIGASVVTIFEFIEFCGALIVKRLKRNQVRLFTARKVTVQPVEMMTA